MREQDLHPLLASRWSPTAFDPRARVTDHELATLVEAARWAPSAGNSQPWAFLTARPGERAHDRLVARLAPSSRRWAPDAGLLVANLCHRHLEGSAVDGAAMDYSEFSLYDLGQAVAHMTIQARALGLQVRQFRAFDRAGVSADFDVPDHWEVSTMSAIGRAQGAGWSDGQHDDGRHPERLRRPRSEVLWPAAASSHRS